MTLNIEINEAELKQLILHHLQSKLGDIKLDDNALKIEVKSKQNYKSEWEPAAFRATYQHFSA